jgi:hypothetical protein
MYWRNVRGEPTAHTGHNKYFWAVPISVGGNFINRGLPVVEVPFCNLLDVLLAALGGSR